VGEAFRLDSFAARCRSLGEAIRASMIAAGKTLPRGLSEDCVAMRFKRWVIE